MAEYPERRDPRLVIGVIVVVITILIASIAFINFYQSEPRTLRVYTYDSFMKWGPDNDEVIFGPFEQRHNVNVSIERLQTDASGIITRLAAESANPVADVVIGIDNILILKEVAKSVLEPYISPNIGQINSTWIDYLDPDHYVTPFDLGLVTLIYQPSTINITSNPDIDNMTLATLATYADAFVTENPRFASPGLAFLLSEIAISEKLLNENWEDWWIAVNEEISVPQGWTEAWTVWYETPTRHFLNSYGADPAYSAYNYGSPPDTAIAPLHHNGTDYAWLQVEGIGLVKDGPNPDLAKLFIDYCLTAEVQDYIDVNQWMFPANHMVELDDVFEYALHPDNVTILNDLLPRTEIAANLESWLDQWDEIRTG